MVSILSIPFYCFLIPFWWLMLQGLHQISAFTRAFIAMVSPSKISDCQVLIRYNARPKASHYDHQVLICYKVRPKVLFNSHYKI